MFVLLAKFLSTTGTSSLQRLRSNDSAPQTTSKADPKAVSAHGIAAAMAADSSRPLDMLIIANRLEKGAFQPC